MRSLINFLRHFIYKYIIGGSPQAEIQEYEDRAEEIEPRIHKIEHEAIFAVDKGYLVVVINHELDDVPGWVEWDKSREIVSIINQNGHIREASAALKDDFITILMEQKKLLLISNNNDKKIMHYLPFLARN